MVNAFRLLDSLKRASNTKEGLWYKEWFSMFEPKLDVLRSESALRPLVGTLQVRIRVMQGALRDSKDAALAESVVGEALSTGSKNGYTVDYDLRFEPKGNAWMFLDGKSHTSVQDIIGDHSWATLTPGMLREHPNTIHSLIIEILSRSGGPQKTPQKRAAQV
jgi:hypothetical protein